MLERGISLRRHPCLTLWTALALLSAGPAWAQSGNGAVVYTYDALGRVTSASYDNNTTITYTYDAAGNRTSQAVAVGSPPGSPPSPPPTPGLLPGPTLWSVSGSNIYYSAGNVGVNATTPVDMFDVGGNVGIIGTNAVLYERGGNATTNLNIDFPELTSAAATLRYFRSTNTTGSLGMSIFKGDNTATLQDSFNTTGNTALNLVGGNLGVGIAAPTYKLYVNGTAYAVGAAGALSDRRHKDEIRPLAIDGLATVEKLRPVSFVWKEPKDDGMKGAQIGFIAQDVEKILPQVVLTADDEDKTKGLKYDELIPVLTLAVQELKAADDKAIKELRAANANQAAQIRTLQDEIKRLRDRQVASSEK